MLAISSDAQICSVVTTPTTNEVVIDLNVILSCMEGRILHNEIIHLVITIHWHEHLKHDALFM